MPNIRGFDAPSGLGLAPSETGVEAAAGAGRRIGAFYNQAADSLREVASAKLQVAASQQDLGSRIGSTVRDVGDAVEQYETHREVSAGSSSFAQLQLDLTNKWSDFVKNADPNDPSLAAKFNETQLQPALEKFKSAFSTERAQNWAETKADALQQHFATKTAAYMSTLAGIAVHKNLNDSATAMSNTAFVDPSSVGHLLADADHTVAGVVGSSPNLKGADAARVRGEATDTLKASIVKSGFQGAIQKAQDPEAEAQKWIKQYPEYINGAEAAQFAKAAKVQAKSNSLVDKQTQIVQRQLAEQNVHVAASKTLTDNVKFDPQTGQLTIDPNYFKDSLAIAQKYGATAPNAAETARALISWGQSQQNKELKAVTDPSVASDIDGRMFSSDNPISKIDILNAESAGKLTRADGEIRMQIIDERDRMPTDPQFKLAMDGAKQMIEGRTAGEKSLQAGKYAAFMQQFLQDYQRQKSAGTLPPNALSLSDPNSLLSKTLEAYRSPLSSAISGNGGVSAPAPAAAPGMKYQPGDVVQGSNGPFRFKGGDWRKKENWEPAG